MLDGISIPLGPNIREKGRLRYFFETEQRPYWLLFDIIALHWCYILSKNGETNIILISSTLVIKVYRAYYLLSNSTWAVYTFSYNARQRFDSYRIFLRSNSSFQNCPHFLSSPTGSRVSKTRPAPLALAGAEPRFVSALVNTGRRLARQ